MKNALLFLAFIIGLMNYSCSDVTHTNQYMLYNESKPSYSVDTIYTEKRLELIRTYSWEGQIFDTILVRIAKVSVFSNDVPMSTVRRYIRAKYNVDEVVINRPASFYLKRSADRSSLSKTLGISGSLVSGGIIAISLSQGSVAGVWIAGGVGIISAVSTIVLSYKSDDDVRQAAKIMEKNKQ